MNNKTIDKDKALEELRSQLAGLSDPLEIEAKEAEIKAKESEKYSNEELIQQSLKLEDEKQSKDYEIIGQIHGTYIIAQSKDGFILVDQHAAMERIRYESYQKLFASPSAIVDLLIPLVIELPLNEYQIVVDNLSLLEKLHINAEVFGTNTIKITQIPYYFKRIDLKVYVDDTINYITDSNVSANAIIAKMVKKIVFI